MVLPLTYIRRRCHHYHLTLMTIVLSFFVVVVTVDGHNGNNNDRCCASSKCCRRIITFSVSSLSCFHIFSLSHFHTFTLFKNLDNKFFISGQQIYFADFHFWFFIWLRIIILFYFGISFFSLSHFHTFTLSHFSYV